ncbi:MAG TPA: DUF4105 domain-containing protein [Anaeromyxobacteraceae bacterium]|nr:DUF4105 domain-containing protein [Anaeromyxobacteraceae bacterium]
MLRPILPLLALLALPSPVSSQAPAAQDPPLSPTGGEGQGEGAAAQAQAPATVAMPDRAYLAELQRKARELRLSDDVGWLRLGHWRPRLLGGVKSEADGREFFLAKEGKTDPAAELDATLAGFFDASPKAEELDDAQCRFPARFGYLGAKLGFDLARLPARRCPRFEEFYGRVKATGATLVFSSWYLNNPASAFGHTFLRLDQAGESRAGRDAELLDYAVDYSAHVDTGNALLYAFKGLTGLFEGRFNHYPYYYKVREYAEYESRDLWEYDLALSPGEVAMLVAHLWELGGTRFDYWYLDENCSYHILGALEAAAPRLELLSHVGPLVILPSETVKALYRNPGLVKQAQYRPSLRRQFDARISLLRDAEADFVEPLASDPDTALPAVPPPRQAAVLDAALDLLDFRRGREILIGADAEGAATRQRLLERRSRLGVQSPRLDLTPPQEGRPQVGHPSVRAGLGAGVTDGAGAVALTDFREALHDLGDPDAGYPPTSQMEFLSARLALSTETARLEALDASLVRVTSLNGVSRFERRPSWRMRFGADLLKDGGCERCVAAVAEVGGGFAALRLWDSLDLYAGADTVLDWSPRLDGILASRVRVGVGPSALARLRLGDRFSLVANGRYRFLPFTALHAAWSTGAEARVHLGRRFSVAATWRLDPTDQLAGALLLGYF